MADRKDEIIRAAQTVFASLGYRKTSLDDVARQMDITRTALYYHYKNKEELFKAVLEFEMESYSGKIFEKVSDNTETIPRLHAYCEEYIRLRDSFINMYQLSTSDIHSLRDTLRKFRDNFETLHVRLLMDTLKRDPGLASHPDLYETSTILVRSIKGVIVASYDEKREAVIQKIKKLCEIYYLGLRTEADR